MFRLFVSTHFTYTEPFINSTPLFNKNMNALFMNEL